MSIPLVDRLLAKDPDDRPASADDLVEEVVALRRSTRRMRRVRQPYWITKLTRVPHGIKSLAAGLIARVPEGLIRSDHRPVLHQRIVRLAGLLLAIVGTATWYVVTSPSAPVSEYLSKAEDAFREDRLAYPKADSAFHYYEEALKLDPENRQAQQGLAEIADRYADLAEQEINEHKFGNARFYVTKGLEVQADNGRLLALRRETRPLNSVPEKIVDGFKRVFIDR